jgi:transcriptional regulator with XRE-family HTH domain
MAIGSHIEAWRLVRGESLQSVAAKLDLSDDALARIESGEGDPPASLIETIAQTLGIPPSWLFGHPKEFALLFKEEEEGGLEQFPSGLDPVVERMLRASRTDRALFTLLTTLLQSGDDKLIRAAEMSLRSLVKQSRQASVPWQSRPSGHFEPPRD